MLDMARDAIVTGAGLFWRAAWALALGYAISAAIQVSSPDGQRLNGSVTAVLRS